MTATHTIVVRGGPLNDHDQMAEREVTVEGEERLDAYTAIPANGGSLVEPPMEPPSGVKLYRRRGTIYVWA
jgi:hypothetical protein